MCPPSSSAATLHVPEDYPAIQQAIVAASPGDTILVGPGTYTENLHIRKFLTLVGRDGPSSTVVDGNYEGSVVVVDSGGVVEGLTLRHGRAQDGGGVRIGPLGRTQIRNNVIENNAAGFVFDSGRGGGLFIDSSTSDVIVQENDILGNNAGASGGGIFEEITGASNHQIRRNRIKGNGCHFCGGGASLWRASFTYNLVLENSTDTYAGGICSEHADVSNNTVVGNHATVVGGAGIYITGGLAINNIIVGNEPGGIECAEQNEGPPRLECNDSWGNNGSNFLIFGACDSTRNFSFDPVFCDSASADYSIAPNSPCAPDHSGGCDLIGAFPVGAKCRLTPANRITWGKLKTLYR